MFKPAGTVTGLYREDYNYSPTAAVFNPYRDVWRDRKMSSSATLSDDTDGDYAERIHQKKKDKN